MVDPKRKDSARRCAFCGNPGVSREHVWPDWLGELLRERFGATSWTSVYGNRRYTQPTIEGVVKRVCEPCNNGWMSDIESEAKPILVPLMFAERPAIELTPEAQRTLATWAVKTALMAAFLYPTSPYAPWVYSGFFADRRPPDYHAAVWTAAYRGADRTLLSVVNRVTFEVSHSYNRDGILEAKPSKQPAVIASLRVLRAIFQVLVYDGYSTPPRHPREDTFFHRIWPEEPRTIAWPRDNLALDDAGFQRISGQRGTFLAFAVPVRVPPPSA